MERTALFLLLVVVGLRPLIQESHESAETPVGRILGEGQNPSPAMTMAIDGVIAAAAALWMVSAALGGRLIWRASGIGGWALLIAAAAVGSLAAASDKRITINATLDWLLLPVLAVVLRQLLRRPWQIRLALAVIVASAAAFAAECFHQKFVTFPETIAEYEQNLRDRMWAQRGLEPDDPEVLLFEGRLRAQEARGFFAHSNIAAGYLTICAFAGLGLAWSKLLAARRPFRRGWAAGAALIALFIAVPILWTGSKGAMAAGGMAGLVWIALLIGRGWVARNALRVLVWGWAAVAVGSAAVTVHGLIHDGLPGTSMAVRWMYWKAAAGMTADHPLAGVGLGNFGKHYTRYKGIESSEEVRDPHNLLAAAASQWGIAGAVGLIGMLAGGSVAVCRSGKPAEADSDIGDAAPPPNAIGQLTMLAIGIFAVRAACLDWQQPEYVLFVTVTPLIVWAVSVAVLSTDSNRFGEWADDAMPGLRAGVGCGLIAFLIHNGVEFSLFEPGPATTAFALFAVLLAGGRPESDTAGHPLSGVGRWAMAGGGVLAMAVWAALARPVVQANALLADGRVLTSAGRTAEAVEAFDHAALADPLDPTPPNEAADALAALAMKPGESPAERLEAAVARVQEAARRDPEEVSNYRRLMRLQGAIFQIDRESDAGRAALQAARKAVELYPSLPAGHEQLADTISALASRTGEPILLAEAIREYETALALDDQRPPNEVRRYPPRKRDEIRSKIESLRALGAASVR